MMSRVCTACATWQMNAALKQRFMPPKALAFRGSLPVLRFCLNDMAVFMNTCFTPTSRHEPALPSQEVVDRLALALDTAILDFCEVAFAPYGSEDFYRRLIDERYVEPDLISVHAMSLHLLMHREFIVSDFRDALLSVHPQANEHAACSGDTVCAAASMLRRAVCRLEGHHRTPASHAAPGVHPLGAAAFVAKPEDELLLSALVLDGVKTLFPFQAGIDAPTLALFLMCLQRALESELPTLL